MSCVTSVDVQLPQVSSDSLREKVSGRAIKAFGIGNYSALKGLEQAKIGLYWPLGTENHLIERKQKRFSQSGKGVMQRFTRRDGHRHRCLGDGHVRADKF